MVWSRLTHCTSLTNCQLCIKCTWCNLAHTSRTY
jgi:hypothetical protein